MKSTSKVTHAGTLSGIVNPSKKPAYALLFLSMAAVLATAISTPIHAQSTNSTTFTPDISPYTPEQLSAITDLMAKRAPTRIIDDHEFRSADQRDKLRLSQGTKSNASDDLTTAIGVFSLAKGERSSALGYGSEASGVSSTAVGGLSTATGSLSTAVGLMAQAGGATSVAVGDASTASGSDSIAIGGFSQATNDYSLASGSYSKASGIQSSAYGYFSKAEGDHSTASGDHSSASGANSTALGSQAVASASNSVALGQGSIADQSNTVSVGSAQNQRRVTNVAAGTQDTDAVNLKQLNGDIGKLQNQFNSGISNVQNWTRSYVDQKTQAVSRAAYSGIAGATALTMIPDVDSGKRFAVGVGTGHYRGYNAGAVGISARVSENIKLKAGLGFSSNGNTAGAGASYQW